MTFIWKVGDSIVEVVKEGKPKNQKIKCPSCNSELKFTNLDEKSEYIPDVPFEGQATNWYITCPKCNRYVFTRALTDKGYYRWSKDCEETN